MGLFDKLKKASDKIFDGLTDKVFENVLSNTEKPQKESPVIAKMRKLENENRELDALLKKYSSTKNVLTKEQRDELRKKKELEEKDANKKLKNELIQKYGEVTGKRIYNKELFVGMTLEMLKDVKGRHSEKVENVTNGKTKVKLYFEKSKNRLGNISYGFEVSLENDLVIGWKDRKNRGTKEI